MTHMLAHTIPGVVAGLIILGWAAPVAGMAPRPSRAALKSTQFPGDPPNISPSGEGGWLAKSPMPLAVYGARACEVDDLVYVFGGLTAQMTHAPVLVYDPAADTWQMRGGPRILRNHSAVCTLDGLVYVVGGEDADAMLGSRLSVLEVYDLRTDSWRALASMPTPRSCLAACALDGLVYAIGGFGALRGWEVEGTLAVVEAYDPVADTWITKAPLPTAVAYPYACTIDGLIYVFAGGSGAGQGSVYAYDPTIDRWTTKATGLVVGLNPAAVEVIDGLVYLFEPEAVVVYDPRENAFTLKRPMPTTRCDVASAAINGRAYLFGGARGPVDDNLVVASGVYATNEMFAPIPPPPVIARQPVAQSVTASGTLALSVDASSEFGAVTYQWRRDSVDIPGADGATLELPGAQHCHSGAYAVVVGNGFGSTTSEVAQIEVELPAAYGARLLNLSTRALCLGGESALIPGFVIAGSGTKQVLLRAVGPKLAELGVSGVLADPTLRLRRLVGATWEDIAANDDWLAQQDGGNSDLVAGAAYRVGAFALDLAGRDAALVVDLAPGVYSVAGAGKDGCTGVELVELYDADRADAGACPARFANLSTRGFVGTGAEVMIPGFVVSNDGPKAFLVRAVGPGLQAYGVSGVLADPRLAIFRRLNGDTPVDERIAENDNWSDVDAAFTAAVAEQVGAFALAAGSKDAAMVVALPPGVYTAVASGADGGTGIALVEIYEVP